MTEEEKKAPEKEEPETKEKPEEAPEGLTATERIENGIKQVVKKETEIVDNVKELVGKQESLDKRVNKLEGKVERIDIRTTQEMVNWDRAKGAPTDRMGWDNDDRKLFAEWYAYSFAPDIMRRTGLKIDNVWQKEIETWETKMAPKFNEWHAKNIISRGAFPEWSGKADVPHGVAQTGHGLEWVPAPLMQGLLALMFRDGIIFREATKYPLALTSVKWPKLDASGFSAEYPLDEGEAPTGEAQAVTTSTFDLTAKRCVVFAQFFRRFILDARFYGLQVVDYAVEGIKKAVLKEIDTQSFVGTTAGGNRIDGLCVDANVTDWALSAGKITWEAITWTDWRFFRKQIAAEDQTNCKFWTSPECLAHIECLENTAGNPMYKHIADEVHGRLWRRPVVEVDVMSETDAATEVAGLYGNMRDWFAYGVLEDMLVSQTDQLNWKKDLIDVKLEMMLDIKISWAAKWQRMIFTAA